TTGASRGLPSRSTLPRPSPRCPPSSQGRAKQASSLYPSMSSLPDPKLKPTILILTVPHGASHRNAASALARALMESEPGARVEVADALARSAAWFRAYYNSYEIPLKLWPDLWGRIESVQHQS